MDHPFETGPAPGIAGRQAILLTAWRPTGAIDNHY
jgi:hypothetical protein